MSQKQLIEQEMNVAVGLDLGDKHSFVCLVDLDGKVVERKKLRTSPAAFERAAPPGPNFVEHRVLQMTPPRVRMEARLDVRP